MRRSLFAKLYITHSDSIIRTVAFGIEIFVIQNLKAHDVHLNSRMSRVYLRKSNPSPPRLHLLLWMVDSKTQGIPHVRDDYEKGNSRTNLG